MKYIKWKSLIATSIVCLLPIILGIAVWDKLPDKMVTHFNINNQPDGYSSKGFAVFMIPVIMTFINIICCIVADMGNKKHTEKNNYDGIAKWSIPPFAIIIQLMLLYYNLGKSIDIRKTVAVIVGIMFIVLGIIAPKLNYTKKYDITDPKAKTLNRYIGVATIVMGVLSIISVFFSSISTLIWILLLIPYSVICIVIGIKIEKISKK